MHSAEVGGSPCQRSQDELACISSIKGAWSFLLHGSLLSMLTERRNKRHLLSLTIPLCSTLEHMFYTIPASPLSYSHTFKRKGAQCQTHHTGAGLPKKRACGETSRDTIDPAARRANSPIVRPQRMTKLAPIDAPYFTRVSVISQSSALLILPSRVKACGSKSFVKQTKHTDQLLPLPFHASAYTKHRSVVAMGEQETSPLSILICPLLFLAFQSY